VFYVTCADGSVIKPTIIHQGQEDRINMSNRAMGDEVANGLPAKFLPKSVNSLQSPSGYMTKDNFMATARHLVEMLPNIRPYILYLDGHESHWCKEALDYLADNAIFPCFLRSQNSENDQPNDNGANSGLKADYGEEMEIWKAEDTTRIMLPLKPW
jgi:hypothetical protein